MIILCMCKTSLRVVNLNHEINIFRVKVFLPFSWTFHIQDMVMSGLGSD